MSRIGADDYLTICQQCGCVFDYSYAFDPATGLSVCPACKHEYELPKNSCINNSIKIDNFKSRIESLRKWLNEERITEEKKFVSNEELYSYFK